MKRHLEIIKLYKEILLRKPDIGGLNNYINSNLSIEEIRKILLLSEENKDNEYEDGVKIIASFAECNFDFYVHNPQKDIISKELVHLGLWEKTISDIWFNHIQSNDVVVDIGANIGWHSKLAELKGANVIAFEPEIKNIKLLKRNTTRTIIHEICLGAAPGEVQLEANTSTNRGGNFVRNKNSLTQDHARSSEIQICRMDTLDNIIGNDASKIKAIKMDVEGYETFVIEGATNTISNLLPGCLIIFELHPYNLNLENYKFLLDRLYNVYGKYTWDGKDYTMEEISRLAPEMAVNNPGHFFDVVGYIK